jgi:hypothetical protein
MELDRRGQLEDSGLFRPLSPPSPFPSWHNASFEMAELHHSATETHFTLLCTLGVHPETQNGLLADSDG